MSRATTLAPQSALVDTLTILRPTVQRVRLVEDLIMLTPQLDSMLHTKVLPTRQRLPTMELITWVEVLFQSSPRLIATLTGAPHL